MKVFHVSNYERGSWGFYQELDLVVLAESKELAIEKAMYAYNSRDPGRYRDAYWKAEELTDDVNYISSSCS